MEAIKLYLEDFTNSKSIGFKNMESCSSEEFECSLNSFKKQLIKYNLDSLKEIVLIKENFNNIIKNLKDELNQKRSELVGLKYPSLIEDQRVCH